MGRGVAEDMSGACRLPCNRRRAAMTTQAMSIRWPCVRWIRH